MQSNLATSADLMRHQRSQSRAEGSTETEPVSATQTQRTLGLGTIAFGVFLGNLMFGAVAAAVYFVFTSH